MSLEQFTYSYIFKISQSVYYTMNQLYMICTSTKSFIFLFLSQKSLYKTATFVTNKTKSKGNGQKGGKEDTKRKKEKGLFTQAA